MFLDHEEESGYYIEEVIEGTSIARVLDMVQYDEKASVPGIKKQIDFDAAKMESFLSSCSRMKCLLKSGLPDWFNFKFHFFVILISPSKFID